MKKKSINELRLDKNVISKFSAKVITGGANTYTCAGSPMTSCNGGCQPGPHKTAVAAGCIESRDLCAIEAPPSPTDFPCLGIDPELGL
ncbi:hypothetical protein ACFFLS_09470 [Flavobacterium procerum]|uniref:Bacteriocin n=1 Tax=Flavobacterium procerum TaxID=1455569 RepID=A0ABV6BP93_9FLAO